MAVEYAEIVRGDVPAHEIPEQATYERPHELTRECWCNPTVVTVDKSIVHRGDAVVKES